MPLITRLSAQKKDNTKVNVFIDGSYALSLDVDTVISLGLKKGQDLTGDELEDLKKRGELSKILAKVYNFLSFRPRSSREIRDRLYKYCSGDKDQIAHALEKLESLGMIDDKAFCIWFIDQRSSHRPRSYRELVSELSKKGIDRKVITSSLSESNYDEELMLDSIISKVSSRYKDNNKLISYLLRRGFSLQLIKQKLK